MKPSFAYFVSKNCSDLLQEKKCSTDREKRLSCFEFTKIILSNREKSEEFLRQNIFSSCNLRFQSDLIFYSEQLKCQLKTIIGM